MAGDNGPVPVPDASNVAEMVLQVDRATGEFGVSGNVTSIVEQIGMLEFALIAVKRNHALKMAQAMPRIVPGVSFPMRKG